MPFSTIAPASAVQQHVAAASLALLFALAALLGMAGCSSAESPQGSAEAPAPSDPAGASSEPAATVSLSAAAADPEAVLAGIPAYSGEPYTVLDGNEPGFTADDATTDAFATYAPLDDLGRCGQAFACLGPETLPTGERGDISEVHPSGWQQAAYDFIDGGVLYNRCHLIAFQLSGENANERNLITGTRYLNTEGMLGFEEMVGDYIRQTGNHVLYRVTPVFAGDELVARGVQMEALSMEDGGAGVRFNVFVYNVQPGVEIDYATGESQPTEEGETGTVGAAAASKEAVAQDYVLNTNSMRFHDPACPSVGDIAPGNRQDVHTTRDELLAQGYEPCGNCTP